MELYQMDQTIRKLVCLYLFLGIATVFASFAFESSLPSSLQEDQTNGIVESMTGITGVAYMIVTIAAVIHLISSVGLLLTKLWAKNWFIYSAISAILPCFFIEAYVDNGIAYSIDQLCMLVGGMIFALLIFNSSYTEAALNKTLKRTP